MKKYAEIDHKAVGERIKSLRGKESQADFGVRFKRSYTDIGRIERGAVKPTPEFLFNICTFYNKSFNWLITGEEEKQKDRVQTSALKKEGVYDQVAAGYKASKKQAPKYYVAEPPGQDPEVTEIMELLQEDPGVKKAVLKLLRGKKEMEAGLAIFQKQMELKKT